MIEITKGRYGYKADDGTIKIAPPGTRLSLAKSEEESLVKRGNAISVETPAEENEEPLPFTEEDPVEEPVEKPRKKRGRKRT